jgi:hypothetical protein
MSTNPIQKSVGQKDYLRPDHTAQWLTRRIEAVGIAVVYRKC